jgi:hypothetical protein
MAGSLHGTKHPLHSPILDQRETESTRRTRELISTCELTVQRSRELMKEAKQLLVRVLSSKRIKR